MHALVPHVTCSVAQTCTPEQMPGVGKEQASNQSLKKHVCKQATETTITGRITNRQISSTGSNHLAQGITRNHRDQHREQQSSTHNQPAYIRHKQQTSINPRSNHNQHTDRRHTSHHAAAIRPPNHQQQGTPCGSHPGCSNPEWTRSPRHATGHRQGTGGAAASWGPCPFRCPVVCPFVSRSVPVRVPFCVPVCVPFCAPLAHNRDS